MPVLRLVLLALIALPFLDAPARADTRSGLMLRPMPEGKNAQLKLEINRYLESKTDAGFDYDMQLFATRGRVRLLPKQERRSPLLGWDVLYIDTDTADPRVPGSLTEASVAVGFGFPVGGDWILGVTAGVGFAGDKPFHGRGWYGLGSLTTTKRIGERDILQFGVDFDGNRPIFPDTPLPLVVWTRIWSPKVRTSIGFPFLGITWEPARWFTFEFRGIPGIFQTGSLNFHVHENWDIFLRYRGANFRFFIDSFPNDNRRLFYTEQRAELGITATIAEQWEITLAAGWAFEREYSTAWDVRDTQTLVALDKAPFFGLTVTVTF
ncbi:MAG: hypothetical protein ACYTF8_09535 [Planctomycetota bacterium]|jgi:hypothetical protein